MKTRILTVLMFCISVFVFTDMVFATHCIIRGKVQRGSALGPGVSGWMIAKTPVEGFGNDTVTTDSEGNYEFLGLPGNVTYTLTPIFPSGWFPVDAIAGNHEVDGSGGEQSTSTRIDSMTLDVFVINGTVNGNNIFIVASDADTVRYRTASMRDWATAVDQKGKLLAVKCKPKKPAMPNLHNVGLDIYGGIRQTPFDIVVGIPQGDRGGNSVHHPKYKDVQKSLNSKGVLHTGDARCLDVFDNNRKPILKQQKSLPVKKHNNKLFAEQLGLKLNVAASDNGQFPVGFGDLIYDNSRKTTSPTHPSFDGKTVRAIMSQVDSFLSCASNPKGVTANDYYEVVKKINDSFSGPIDTVAWGCVKVVLTGVHQLKDVPTFQAQSSLIITPSESPIGTTTFNGIPKDFVLNQNYPNPFNPTTTISFEIAKPSIVSLKVYNMLGQEIAVLLDQEEMDEGIEEVEFDASEVPSGVYFYYLLVIDQEDGVVLHNDVKRMLLMK